MVKTHKKPKFAPQMIILLKKIGVTSPDPPELNISPSQLKILYETLTRAYL